MGGKYNILSKISDDKNSQIDYWRFMEDEKIDAETMIPKSPEILQIDGKGNFIKTTSI